MKHLLLVAGALLFLSISNANDAIIVDSDALVTEKEKQDFSEGYLSQVNLEREGDFIDRQRIRKEHDEYMREIASGIHR